MSAPSLRTGSFLPSCALLLALGGSSASAALARSAAEPAAPASAPTLDSVACENLVQLDCVSLEHHLGLAAGTELTGETLDAALRRLWRTGLVDDVRLRLEATAPGRARLIVAIAERPILDELSLAGFDRLTRTRVERWLAARRPPIPVDLPLDRGALETLRLDLEALLAAERRPAPVEYELIPTGRGRVTAEYRPRAVARAPRLAEIWFEGIAAIEDKTLRRALRNNKRADFAVRLAGGGRLDEAGIEADRQSLTRLYRERGFKDVAIETPRVEPLGTGGAVRLVFPVTEGRRWKLGGLSVSGNRELSDQRLLALFVRDGEWLDLPAIEEWVEEIRSLYAGLGRLDTRVSQRSRERLGGRADIVVTVSEGPVLSLGRLTVTGNTRTLDSVIRGELAVEEGQILDLGAVERGLARLRNRGLFEAAPDALGLERRLDGSGRIDLALDGRDADPYRVDVGGGWSETDGVSGHLSLEARNLGGRGVAAGLRLTEGGVRDRFELYTLDPSFRGRSETASGELFDRDQRLTPVPDETLRREERGLRLGWSRPLAPTQRLRLGLGRSRLTDLRGRDGDGGGVLATDFERSSVAVDWARDTRDEPFRPHRGERIALSLVASVDHGVGGRELLQPRAEIALFRPLGRRVVWATRVEAGTLHASGEVAASPLDAFFLGGPNGVRGFPTASITARDGDGEPLLDADGFRRGGDRFLEAALEIRFPLAGPASGAVFVDLGQVWAEEQSLTFDNARIAAGVELWLQPSWLPLPLRLTWAHNLDPLAGEEFDEFLIGLGAGF